MMNTEQSKLRFYRSGEMIATKNRNGLLMTAGRCTCTTTTTCVACVEIVIKAN